MPATEPPHTHARARLRRLALAIVPALALLVAAAPASASTSTFANPTPIKLPHPGATTPWPSEIAVGGLSGPIADVNVFLWSVSHKWPDDLDVLLVSPTGEKVMLMSDACGEDDIHDYTWFFSQQAARAMSDDSADCGEPMYRPTNYVGPHPPFPTRDFWWSSNPDLQLPHGASLNDFNNENPNGTWKLYVEDDNDDNGGDGDIEFGWSLVIETGPVDTLIPGSGSSGKANPYPASRAVSDHTGLITDLNVGISGISHERLEDLDVLLAGPRGQKVILMSDACGPQGIHSFGWTWDDEAAAPMPTSGAVPCATPLHRPTNYGLVDAWPAPAPPGPYSTSLSSFDLTDPNGEWRLFVYDDADGATGYIVNPNRFHLDISTRPRAAVAFTETALEVAEGTSRALTLRRTGSGALAAGTVTVTAEPATATPTELSLSATVVQFAPGETEKTVQVSALADGRMEPDEAFAVTLGSPTGDARPVTPASVTVTIPAPPATGGGPGGGGPGGGGPGGGGQPGVGDVSAPSFVGAVRAIPRTFAVRSARRPAGAVLSTRGKVKRATTFRYALSEAARVVFAIERKRTGRRVGTACSKPTRANRGRPRCARYARIGVFAQQRASAGRNRTRFSGRIAGRRLSPGRYRATLVATDAAGNASKRERAAFRVVKP